MNSPASPAAAASAQPPAGAPIFDRRDRIVVLTPCYGGILTDCYHNALQACLQVCAWFRMPDGSLEQLPVIADRISLVSESHIDRGRNTLTNIWVNRYEAGAARGTNWRKALWWDADVELPPHHLQRLFIHACKPVSGATEGIGGLPFVCAPYASKTIVPRFVVNVQGGQRPDKKTGLVEVNESGTGAMLWDISVPYKLREHALVKPYACAPNSPWPFTKHYSYFVSGVHGTDLMPIRPPGVPAENWDPANPGQVEHLPQWQSEDWMVCRMWRELGGKVYLDTECKLRHHGMLTYPPNIGDLVDANIEMIEQNNPAVDVARLRTALAKYKPAELKAAA